MDDENEPRRTLIDRIGGAVRRVRRAITGGDADGGREYADPRIGQMKEHERNKMDEFVELAEERGEPAKGEDVEGEPAEGEDVEGEAAEEKDVEESGGR